MKEVKGRCSALESPVQFRVQSQHEGKTVRATVVLPYVESDTAARSKESVAAYNARICLVDAVLGKDVSYFDNGKLPAVSDLTVDGRSLIEKLVQRGLFRLRKDIDAPQQLKAMEAEAKKTKLGVWGEDGTRLRNLPELNEDYLESIVTKLRQTKQPARLLVERVSGLKLFVLCVDYDLTAVIYFSELKIPRVGGLDPKTAWVHVERFLNEAALNHLVEFEFMKEDVYKGEVSLYGTLIVDGKNLRNELLARGLAQLSNNAKSFLSKDQFQVTARLEQAARKESRGLYGLGSKGDKLRERKERQQLEEPIRNIPTLKAPNKFKQYETWIKEERRVNTLTRPVEELAEIVSYLAWDRKEELTDHRIKSMRIVAQVFPVLMLNRIAKYMPQFRDYLKATSVLLTALCDKLATRVQHGESVKLINILLRGLIFCLNEVKDNQQLRKEEYLQVEFESIVRLVFKLIFVGNTVLHQKLFGKKADLQLENFQFSALDYSGVSSMSEVSESEDTVRPAKQDNKRKLHESQLKIRVSASLLLSLILKVVPALLELHWELCVRSNAFSEEFDEHIRQLQVKFTGQTLTAEQRDQVLDMMRVNFGEHSLLCMLIFEENSKVKLNVLESIGLLATTFQGRKILPTLDVNLLEKEQKKALSFVPKSLLVFRAYRNALYTLLFCLYHEKNVNCVQALLRTVTLLVEHTALLQKLPFDQGLDVLLGNFLLPMLSFPTDNSEFAQLQLTVIGCLSAIITNEHEYKELYNRWFDIDGKDNVNRLLLEILKGRLNRHDPLSEQIADGVNNYMAKLALNYLPALIRENLNKQSIWKELSGMFANICSNSFSKVIEQLCRRTCPLKDEDQDDQKEEQQRVSDFQSNFYQQFLERYLPEWLERHEEVASPQQLIDIMEVLTCLNNTTLEKAGYERVRKLLLFCFCRLSYEPASEELLKGSPFQGKQLARAHEFMNNAFVKVAYVKLIGHMSFCEIFHREDIMVIAYLNLRTILREAKGMNTLVRCSWALSNWCNVEGFLKVLTNDQLQETFSSLLDFARSEREKIASNGTRGIGMFIRNLPKTTPLMRSDQVERVMISNINHKSAKVSWNCSVALRNILRSPNAEICQRLFERVPFIESLLHNFSRSNYKLQIQTLETLKCLAPAQTASHANSILQRLTDILGETLRHLTEYSFGEFKYINVLRRELIGYYIELMPHLSDAEVLALTQSSLPLFVQSIYQLLTESSSGKEYSKELLERGSESTREVERQIFNLQSTKFHDELLIPVRQSEYRTLLLTLTSADHGFFLRLQRMSQRIVQLLQKSEAKVSLLVGDAFQQFSQMKLQEKSVELKLVELA